MKNFSLLSHYLLESVSTTIQVSSSTFISPISSPSLAPTTTNNLHNMVELNLSNSSSSPSIPQPIEFSVVIGKEIQTTAGKVRRSGIVKLKVLQLLEYLMITKPVVFQTTVIAHDFNKTLLVFFVPLYHCLIGRIYMVCFRGTVLCTTPSLL